MIRFVDIDEYPIHIGEMSRTKLMMFFLQKTEDANIYSDEESFVNSVITVYDEDDSYYGMITYKRLLRNREGDYILRDMLSATDDFFENANNWFDEHPEEELLPVANVAGERVGFCYRDESAVYWPQNAGMQTLYKMKDIMQISLLNYYNCQQIFIMDCNELAYKAYKLFRELEYPVCVFGEKWEWFEIPVLEGYMDIPENKKIYIYAEGNDVVRYQWNVSKRSSVVRSRWLLDWLAANRTILITKIILEKWNRWNNICFVQIPKREDLKYMTADELQADAIGFRMHEVGEWDRDVNSRKKWNLLMQLTDQETIDDILKNREERSAEWFVVDYNEVPALAAKDSDSRKRIYLIGQCLVEGVFQRIEDTLVNRIQELVDDEGYQVVQVTINNENLYKWILFEEYNRIAVKEKDIIIIVGYDKPLSVENIKAIDLASIYNDRNRGNWIMDGAPQHLNKVGVKAVAKAIYEDYIKDKIRELKVAVGTNSYIQKGEILSDVLKEQVEKYVKKIKIKDKQNITVVGSVVVNCNPFTYGHQYLIEHAADKVDLLYVFVVEEDRSEFSFQERMMMVQDGTKHIHNVCVVPSSEWILSYTTMPAYFGKEHIQEEKVSARLDLEIFARYIAPPLNIQHRFVGEEPFDKITKQYNEQMKEILGDFDIQVEEIPRKKLDGKTISASYVRTCIKNNDWEEVKKIVPDSTYKIIAKDN